VKQVPVLGSDDDLRNSSKPAECGGMEYPVSVALPRGPEILGLV
jgi:hypothetical protein